MCEGERLVNDILREFYESLNREERALADKVGADRLGLLMRIAINELDLNSEGLELRNDPTDDQQERLYLMRIGVARIIKLAMQANDLFDAPTVTIQRDLAYSGAVLSLVDAAGALEHGRRVAQSLPGIAGRIEKLPDRFRIVLPAKLADLELHERELERFYIGQYRTRLAEGYGAVVGDRIAGEIKSLLMELVYPYAEHFIGYEADPKLDLYFFGYAYNEMLVSKGFDTFHYSTLFGGVSFANYKLAAIFIVSVAKKHRAFVQALLDKEPSIRIEDILTVSVETVGFVEGLREFINQFGEQFEGHMPVTYDEVRLIFDVISVSRRNLALLDRPGAPLPPLIQCSDDHVIRPLAGSASDEVMLFLLNSLQHRFPKDYDRAQRAREGVMQRAIENAIRSILPTLEFRGNVKLRQARKVLTDIDLVMVAASGDQIILTQLKHQDPYGADLASMLSRTRRLNKQVSDWLVKVRSWLGSASTAELRATFRLPQGSTRPDIRLLVLTRHYAHTLRRVVDGEDVTYSNWNQLVTAIARLQARSGDATVGELIKELRALSVPEVREYLPEPSSVWSIGNLRFTIEQDQV